MGTSEAHYSAASRARGTTFARLEKTLSRCTFNTQFAQRMDTGVLNGEPVTVFAAGDDATAKQQVMQMARDIGFDAVDAGPLESARLLEPLALLNIKLGYVLGLGPNIGFKLVHG